MTETRAVFIGGVVAICALAAFGSTDDTVRLPSVREELLQMVKEDQKARADSLKAQSKDPHAHDTATKQLLDYEVKIDEKNTARLKSLVAEYGWLGKSQVGEDGAHAAWLLLQHANKDPLFQKDCLEKMKQSFKNHDVSATDLAYLIDRVAVSENKKQIYGTQFHGNCDNLKPQPIEDEQHVNDRRKSIGLGTMAEYEKQMKGTYCKAKTGQVR